jgi:uncharacterized membrane protein
MSKTAARIALVCALVGLGVSGAAAYTHYHMLRDPTYHSFCDVSATVSCTQVYQSRHFRSALVRRRRAAGGCRAHGTADRP